MQAAQPRNAHACDSSNSSPRIRWEPPGAASLPRPPVGRGVRARVPGKDVAFAQRSDILMGGRLARSVCARRHRYFLCLACRLAVCFAVGPSRPSPESVLRPVSALAKDGCQWLEDRHDTRREKRAPTQARARRWHSGSGKAEANRGCQRFNVNGQPICLALSDVGGASPHGQLTHCWRPEHTIVY